MMHVLGVKCLLGCYLRKKTIFVLDKVEKLNYILQYMCQIYYGQPTEYYDFKGVCICVYWTKLRIVPLHYRYNS